MKEGSKLGMVLKIVEDEWIDNLTNYILVLPYYYFNFFSEMLSKHIKIGESKYLIVLLPFPKLIKIEGTKKHE